MNCEQARALKHAYADGEADALRLVEIEEHLLHCPTCCRAAENLQTLRSALRTDALYYKAPAALKTHVRAALRAETRKAPGGWAFSWAWLKVAIPLGATAGVLALAMTWHGAGRDSQLVQEITSSHVRSLMVDHLTDVASTDQHTVKPWFTGKLDFSPRVLDLSDRGFPLVGGRLDYVGNRPVAALLYERRKHVINLFVWPATGKPAARTSEIITRQGYNLAQWTQAGMTYWAVSDLNSRELSDFVHALQSAP
jgi:anti-sigma factor RsiW